MNKNEQLSGCTSRFCVHSEETILIDKNNSGFLQFIKDGQINESVKIKKGNINK